VAQVAVGKREVVNVFGDDYDTPDGTGVRDYIHVVDLALGHLSALKRFDQPGKFYEVYNLGTGIGQDHLSLFSPLLSSPGLFISHSSSPISYSVLEMVKAMGKACKKELPVKVGLRRAGDVATVYADPKLANDKVSFTSFRHNSDRIPHVSPPHHTLAPLEGYQGIG